MKSCRGTSDRDSLSRSQHPKPDAGVPLGSNHLATWNIAIRHFDIQSASQIFKKQLTPARRNEGIIQADRVRVVAREATRHGKHTRRRGLLARLLPVRRTTFVIDTDRTVLKVVSNEVRASVHADQTLWFLENHNVSHSSSYVRQKHTDARQQSEGKGEPSGDWFREPETAEEPQLGPAKHADGRPYRLWC